jgi:hypothetical protein
MMAGRLFIYGSLGILLAGAVYAMVTLWARFDDPQAPMSGIGITMMVFGIVFSILVGSGLMALAFYSARSGHDERVDGENL